MIKHIFNSILALGLVIIISCASESKEFDPLMYVDPFIGNDAHGHTFPGATTPFGMVQLSPSNGFKSWDWCSGYHYSDSIVKGFAHSHISGAGLAGLGDILFMPTTGELKVIPGTEEDPESGFRSRFSHDTEKASAGYYAVKLKDYDVTVELTASPRVGFHRYTFNKGGKVNVIVDPAHNISERIFDTEVEVLSNTEIRGYKNSAGDGGNRKVYFYAKFSTPFATSGVAKDDKILDKEKSANGINTKLFARFDVIDGEILEVKVALSNVSYEGALLNYEAEAEYKSFDVAQSDAEGMWRDKLGRIEIENKSVEQKRVFYSGMYHAFISPNLFSDVDGKYVIDGKVYHSDYPHYSNFSTWDTYRALHPLFNIIEHGKNKDFVNSIISRHFDSKVGLPVWELMGFDNACMIGYNTVSPIVDAALKGVEGVDPESVLEAAIAAANNLDKHSPVYDKNGMLEYLELDFVPAEINCAVSKTTEQNYYDWTISELAKMLGKNQEAGKYAQRSLGYRNLFYPETGFLHSKFATGEWREQDVTKWDDLKGNYVSGNIWGYSTYVPHDMNGLIDMLGGKENYIQWLDKIFTDTTTPEGHVHVDISGFIGKYGHGDEPSQHMPYLYNYAGQGWKTQELVRQVMKDFYTDKPDGLVNNEDLGQMSAWYIFSSIGFYPVCPGDNRYLIGSPLHAKTTFRLENGKEFTVKANKVSEKNKYVQSATLNGEPYSKSYIMHNNIMDGGELVLVMGSKPNKNWAAKEGDVPVSRVSIPEGYVSNKMPIVAKPFDANKDNVFVRTRTVELSSKTEGATIYYTTNGSKPGDKSKKYSGPITINKNTVLKVIAYKEGFKPSFIYNREYLKGNDFAGQEGFPAFKSKFPAGGYGLADCSQVFDREVGSAHYADGKWTAWRGDDMVATIDFGQQQTISNVSVGYLTYPGVWIFPPKFIEVYISDNNKDFIQVGTKKIHIDKNHPADPFVTRDMVKFKGQTARYLKVVAKNTGVIPDWHGATGHKPWLFIDEILIN